MAVRAGHHERIRGRDPRDLQEALAFQTARRDRLAASPLRERFTNSYELGMCAQDRGRDLVGH
jgi:hypothetical protein